MELSIFVFAGVVLLAFIAELIDSSLGMLYGTMLSPIFIMLGFDPLVYIPALLLSQSAGGLVAAIRHHNHGNANFQFHTQDFKSFVIITIPGLIAVIFGALVAIMIPKDLIKLYIAILVTIVGLVVVFKINSKFSWKKMGLIGFISSFNKALSGGGFGPFVTGGQIAIGQKSKNSIGVTTLAEVPITAASFIAYFILKGFNDWNFLGALMIGAVAGAAIGPRITKEAEEKKIKFAVGITVLLLGLVSLANAAGFLKLQINA